MLLVQYSSTYTGYAEKMFLEVYVSVCLCACVYTSFHCKAMLILQAIISELKSFIKNTSKHVNDLKSVT